MKLFLFGILKCKKCPFTTKLNLNVVEANEPELDYCENNNFDIFKKNDCSFIRELINNLGLDEITEVDLKEFCTSKNEKIEKLLFKTDIVKGYLTCVECKTVYPIHNSILDMVDTQ